VGRVSGWNWLLHEQRVVSPMTHNDGKQVVLERGNGKDSVIGVNPSLQLVMNQMDVIEGENGMGGPPDLVLKYCDYTSSTGKPQAVLYLMLAFHSTQPSCWIVNFSIPKANGQSLLLASSVLSNRHFDRRTCCGVISLYRHDCLINDQALLGKAIAWFVEHHSACPELTWIPYDEAVHDADNRIE